MISPFFANEPIFFYPFFRAENRCSENSCPRTPYFLGTCYPQEAKSILHYCPKHVQNFNDDSSCGGDWRDGQSWSCGVVSAAAMVKIVDEKWIKPN